MKKILVYLVFCAFLITSFPGLGKAIVIQLPKAKITAPSTGEVWYTGQVYKIVWDAGSTYNSTSVSISLNNASCLNSYCIALAPYQIATEAKNTGVYEWKIPTDIGSYFKGKQYISVSPNYSETINSGIFTISDSDTKPPVLEFGISTKSDLKGEVGKYFSASFLGSGGSLPYTWSLSGSIPEGFQLMVPPAPLYCPLPDCKISDPADILLVGIPKVAGNFKIKLTLKDANGRSITSEYNLVVSEKQNGQDNNSIESTTRPALPTRVIKIDGDPTVYLVTPRGKLVPLPSVAALNSNGFKFSDIKVIESQNLNRSSTLYIRLNGNGRIYKLENGKRRPITSPAWINLGAPAEDIVDLNTTTFYSFKLGATIY